MDKNKLVDFLTEKIFEEGQDSSTYLQWSQSCTNSSIKSNFEKIAEDESMHQKILIKILAELAKENK